MTDLQMAKLIVKRIIIRRGYNPAHVVSKDIDKAAFLVLRSLGPEKVKSLYKSKGAWQ